MTDVVMINDGAIDEFVAATLLAAAPGINLRGVVMVDADCIGRIACEAMWKVNALAGFDIPVSLSSCRGLNAFPWSYRTGCVDTVDLPIVRQQPAPPWTLPPDGDAFLAETLDQAKTPITIVSTGPITPLLQAFEERPERATLVNEIVWMAGAVDVPGNLDPTTIPAVMCNPFAEWNLFWDPPGSQRLLDLYAGPITLLPLDISDSLKIDDETFLPPLFEAASKKAFARFCYDAYQTVADQPFFRLWDTVTVLYVLRPDLFAPPKVMPMRVITDPLDRQGALVDSVDGKPLHMVLDFSNGGPAAASREIVSLIAAVGATV